MNDHLSQSQAGIPSQNGLASVLIVVPTYNERENLPTLLMRLRATVPEADLLVVDDNSPDKTGVLADQAAAADPHIHVLHRAGKEGLGRAYVAGFGWGLARGYCTLVQMDADLSHNPSAVPSLLHASEQDGIGLVIGSRYVRGGGTVNWGLRRRLLSRIGSLYARSVLGVPVRDMTGGFKCWRRQVLEDIEFTSIQASGYAFQIETTYRALRRQHTVREIPITFTDRIDGQSKMSRRIVLEALAIVLRLRLSSLQSKTAEPVRSSAKPTAAEHRTG